MSGMWSNWHGKEARKDPFWRNKSEPDWEMAQKLDLWEKWLKNSMINLLKDLGRNVGNMHEQIGNFSSEVETI